MLSYNPFPLPQSTVDLLHHVFIRIRIPILASLRDHLRNSQRIDILWPLHESHEQALTQMERNMAMERPCPGIISIVLDDHVSKWREVLRISTLRVARSCDGAIPGSIAAGEDVEIVAVQVHWVRTRVVVVDVDADAAVCQEVYDIPLRVIGVGVVLLLGEEQYGVVVIALEGVAVHVEELLACCIDELVDGYVIGDAGLGKSDGVVWNCFVERILGRVSKCSCTSIIYERITYVGAEPIVDWVWPCR